MKKADEIRDKFSARVAVFIEKDGILHAYLSDGEFPAQLPGSLNPANLTTPEHFMTVAQKRREGSPISQRSLDSTALSLGFAFPNLPLGQRPAPSGSSKSPPNPMVRDYFNFPDIDPEMEFEP